MINLFKYELLSRIGAIVGWGIGLILFGAMYIGIYPEMADQLAQFDLSQISIYQAMGVEMGSFEGFVASSVVQFIPILLGIYAIMNGTSTLAGEEDNGTLELILATPLARWQIVTSKAMAMILSALVILIIAGAGNALVFNAIAEDIQTTMTNTSLFIAIISGFPIVIAFMMLSFFLGAYLPNRRIATVVATVIFVANYFGENIAGLVESLEFIKPFSLFSYFDSTSKIFSEGIVFNDVILLMGVTAIFFALALFSFQRRNVTVGVWFWQRS